MTTMTDPVELADMTDDEKLTLARTMFCAWDTMDDDRVFVERVDDVDSVGGSHGEVPVVGILRMAGGRVTEWLEYCDRPTLLAGMGVGAPAH